MKLKDLFEFAGVDPSNHKVQKLIEDHNQELVKFKQSIIDIVKQHKQLFKRLEDA